MRSEPTRLMEDSFERLSLEHGSIRVKIYVEALDDTVRAYVRGIDGSRYEVNNLGQCKRIGNHDAAPYYDHHDLETQKELSGVTAQSLLYS